MEILFKIMQLVFNLLEIGILLFLIREWYTLNRILIKESSVRDRKRIELEEKVERLENEEKPK